MVPRIFLQNRKQRFQQIIRNWTAIRCNIYFPALLYLTKAMTADFNLSRKWRPHCININKRKEQQIGQRRILRTTCNIVQISVIHTWWFTQNHFRQKWHRGFWSCQTGHLSRRSSVLLAEFMGNFLLESKKAALNC